jgi:molecular chaperone DnaK
MGKVIGIDLGTTNSVCAYVDRRDPVVIINAEGGRITPSVVGISKDGERFVGDIAKRQLLINPEATVHSIKRFMGRRYAEAQHEMGLVQYKVVETPNGDCGVEIRGRVYMPQEVAAMILQKLRRSAEDFLGEGVTEAVITVPAYFTDRQRQATKDAGTIAGLDVLRILNEPTAAALSYVHNRKKSSTIAVYDFGGGTFDISILEVDRDLAEVRATRGNNALGGADLDQHVVTWLLDRFHKEHNLDISQDKVVLQRLRDAAERAKVELSSAMQAEIHLPFLVADSAGPKHLQCTLSRSVFEGLAQDLFDSTLFECEQALNDCRMGPQDIDEVILVGGSSRIPRIQEMVQTLFGRPLNKSFNPDEVVAVGAAIQAGILEGDVKAVTLLDVTNFSLGLEVAGRRCAPLIPKNTTLPTQKTQMVSSVVDNQSVVKIHILQGESQSALENVSLGEFELQGIEPAPRGEPRIQVKFSIDTNGIVQVSARDERSGVTNQVTIESPTGMTPMQLDDAKAEAATAYGTSTAASPVEEESSELRQLREQVEKQLASLEGFLRDNRGFLYKKDIFEIEQALKRGRMALLKSSDKSNLDELSTYLARFFAHLADKAGGGDAPIH